MRNDEKGLTLFLTKALSPVLIHFSFMPFLPIPTLAAHSHTNTTSEQRGELRSQLEV